MADPSKAGEQGLAAKPEAPQHRPRPLPLLLDMLRSVTAGDAGRTARALQGLRAYQEAEREPPSPPMPAIGERFGAALRDYGGTGPDVLFVPSLINPPNVLDLDRERSLLRWLAGRGFRVLLLDWGPDIAARRDMDVTAHVEQILVPLSAHAKRPALVGYCLGGTMAMAAAAATPVRAVATIAAPWHFSGFGQEARVMLGQLWQRWRAPAEALDALPMEALQSAFWSLDPERTIAKLERFAAMTPGSREASSFVRLEDWANDGPPLPLAAARQLFEDFVQRDLPGNGGWRVAGAAADPKRLACPQLNIVSTSDRIVPRETAPTAGERIENGRGHVGMVVGSGAKDALWQPLAEWLSRAREA